jgi:hypothetical protein
MYKQIKSKKEHSSKVLPPYGYMAHDSKQMNYVSSYGDNEDYAGFPFLLEDNSGDLRLLLFWPTPG